jgi:transcription elongation factor Elf1
MNKDLLLSFENFTCNRCSCNGTIKEIIDLNWFKKGFKIVYINCKNCRYEWTLLKRNKDNNDSSVL